MSLLTTERRYHCRLIRDTIYTLPIIDEFQHKSMPHIPCDISRMTDVVRSIYLNRLEREMDCEIKLIWIRYNPDNRRIGNKLDKRTNEEKEYELFKNPESIFLMGNFLKRLSLLHGN